MKKTGKALSLVLSLALVASSIPAALASASSAVTMTQVPDVEHAVVFKDGNIAAGDGSGEVALSTLFNKQAVKVTEDKSSVIATDGDTTPATAFDYSAATFSVSSNGNVVKLNAGTKTKDTTGDATTLGSGLTGTDTTIDKVKAVAKIVGGGSSSGTVEATITASNVKVTTDQVLEVSKHNSTDEVKTGTVTLTENLKVYQNGTTLVTTAAPSTGLVAPQAATVGINEAPEFASYTVAPGTTDALATYAAANTTSDVLKFTGSTFAADGTKDGSKGDLVIKAQDNTKDLPTSPVTSTVYVDDGTKTGTQKSNSIAATLTVGTYYTLGTTDVMTVSKVYGTPTKTLLGPDAGPKYDVTNREIHLNSNTLTVTGEDASIGTVTGGTVAAPAGKVIVKSGTVGAINNAAEVYAGCDATPASAFDANKGNIIIGDVTAPKVAIEGSINANDDKTFSSVKVGNITANTVKILTDENADKSAQGQVTVGNVVASTSIEVSTTKDVKTLTAGSFSGKQGEYADCPYTATFTLDKGVLTTGDLLYFTQVTVGVKDVSVASLTAGNIDTGTYANSAVTTPGYGYSLEKKDAASTISILDNSAMNVASLRVEKIPTTCTGSLTIPAGKLILADSYNYTDEAANSGITLYIPNAASGTLLYTSNKKASNVFSIPGIDTIASTPNAQNVYSYSASKASFLGFQMNQKVVSLGSNASTTLTTTNLPAVALPAGVTLKWDSDKKTVTLAPSADTTSCVVTATGYTDANVNGGNNVVVTATLVNKDGSAYIPAASSDKTVGTCSITLTPTVTPTLTTKVTDLDGNTVVVTPDTVIPMQQSTQYRVQFNADIAGISNINYMTGNDKVAQTGTVSAWNGTSGTYTIYTNGAVGSKVGVFANGAKIFQVEVTDRPFICDTSVDFSMKAGKTYTFKITPKAGTKINTFTFLTGKDSALSTWGCKLNADGTATATVKAVSAGTYGVYATINGKNYKVFAITVQ